MLWRITSANCFHVAASIGLGAIFCVSMSGCEDPNASPKAPPASATLGVPAGPVPHAQSKPTSNAQALFVRPRGPSDRPPPVLVFSAADAALTQALADLALVEPMGGTPVLVEPDEFTRLLATIGAGEAMPDDAAARLELEVCGASPRRVLLDGPSAARWSEAAEATLAKDAPGRGYLRSLRSTLPK